jgi:hypothetical protein
METLITSRLGDNVSQGHVQIYEGAYSEHFSQEPIPEGI